MEARVDRLGARSLLALALALAGCGNSSEGPTPDLSSGADLAVDAQVPLDFAMPPDMAVVVPIDMAGTDMANPPDPVLHALKFETAGPITVGIDTGGGPVITGGLINQSRFGSITLAAAGMPGTTVTAQDVFLVTFNKNGQSQFGKRYGDTVDQLGSAVAVNAAGEMLIGGLFSGDLVLSGTVTLTSATDTNFLAAFDKTGVLLWARILDLGAGGFVLGLAADAKDGGFLVAATATAAVTFGSFNGTTGGGKDIFVAKVAGDPAGTLAWARQIGGTGDQSARAVAADANGHAFVVGQFAGALDFGDGALPVPPVGAKNMFVSKLDTATGAAQKSIAIGARGTQLAQSAAVDTTGDVVIAGFLAGNAVTFDAAAGVTLTPAGKDGFVAKLSADLLHARWARRIGDVQVMGDGGTQALDPQEATAVTVDTKGRVTVVGLFAGTTDFGTGTPLAAKGSDAFALSLDAAGQPRWVRSTGGSLDEKASGVSASPVDDSLWVVGTFNSSQSSPPVPNWGYTEANQLVFDLDDGTHGHTFLVHLAP
jgi:hypothetical protein